ncbi:MAG: uracil-DNA glycosylase [Parcubacteria group bacterium]|nr:uracil-DNA glycosylase [Parcubacteria group bacterium]
MKKRFVPGEGSLRAKIVFIGEAPGKEEERLGRPFVGRAGKLLDRSLKEIGLERKKVYITNVVKIRPTNSEGGNRKPTPQEIKKHLPYLTQELKKLKPKIIVLLGATSVEAILGKTYTVSKFHGKIIEKCGRKYLVTYHPAAILRFPKYRRKFQNDLKKLRSNR